MVLWGYVADRWGGERAYTAGSVALIVSIPVLCLAAPGQEVLLYAYAALFALGLASRHGLGPFMAAALVRGRSMGALMGILVAHMALGFALGPAVGGWIFDQTGSYQWAFTLTLLSTVGAMGCVWLAAPRHGLLTAPAAALSLPRDPVRSA